MTTGERTYKPETVVTDEADGAEQFAEWQTVTGKLAGWYVRPNGEDTMRDNKLNCRLGFVIDELTEAVRTDGTTPNLPEVDISWPYAQWDTDEHVAMKPVKRGVWFRGVVPAFIEAGVNPSIEALNALEEAHATITLTYQERPLGYDRRVYENDEVVMVDGEELKEAAIFMACLPSSIQTENSDPEAPARRAAELRSELSDDAEFKKAAAADNTIKRDPKLRRAIQSGKYEAYVTA